MFGLGMPELLIILVIIVIIFGASRLPEIGRGLGKAKNRERYPLIPKRTRAKKKKPMIRSRSRVH